MSPANREIPQPHIQATTVELAHPAAPAPEVLVVAMRPSAEQSSEDGSSQRLIDETSIGIAADLQIDLALRLRRARATGSAGELVVVELDRESPATLVALGVGDGSSSQLRIAGTALARRLRGSARGRVLLTVDLDSGQLRSFVEGVHLAHPTPRWTSGSRPPSSQPLKVLEVASPLEDAPAILTLAEQHALATVSARRLVHTPANIKSPQWLAGEVRELMGGGATTRTVSGPELAELGFAGLVAVGRGSGSPPVLVQVTWESPDPRDDQSDGSLRHVVLVGKGITFDSGGLSLKPPDMQVAMKTDMSGAGVVASVVASVAGMGRSAPRGLRVTALLCLAENMPGGAALRPGDVIEHRGGITSEIGNTDAEGRLVMADALEFAASELAADVVVDVATLTGAATLGLGRHHGALFSTSDGLAAALVDAGAAAGERLWRMPLFEGYRDLISSPVADQNNAASAPGPGPGSITAALFLSRFVQEGIPWAHLDIAGPGRADSERPDAPRGGTGFGARALMRWLEAGAPA